MKKNVIIYSDSLGLVSETFVAALIEYISELNLSLCLLTHKLCGQSAYGERVKVIPRYFKRFTPGWLENYFTMKIFKRELFQLKLEDFLKNNPSDIIHAQFGSAGYYMFDALRRNNNFHPRLIVNFYGYDASGLLTDVPAWRDKYRRMFSYPNLRIVVEGPQMKKKIIALGCDEKLIQEIPLCLKINTINVEKSCSDTPNRNEIVIGFVGRFIEKKGIIFALKNLIPFLRSQRNLKVTLVGYGPQRGLIEKMISDNQLEGRVIIKEIPNYADMLTELSGMSVLLVPSRTASNGDSEGGAPAILAEAQIIGVPIIASDHADIPFALSDHAYLFKEMDSDSFANVFKKFLEEAGRGYNVETARDATLRKYDKEGIKLAYQSLYE